MIDLSDKSICIAGYASYLFNKGYGSYIDEFDIVVRVNNGFNILNTKDQGTKTNILSCSLFRAKTSNMIYAFNVLNKTNYNNIFEIAKLKNIDIISQYDSDIKNEQGNAIHLDKIIPHLTTGLSSILHIIKIGRKAKKIHITGFSFDNFLYPGYDKFVLQPLKRSRLNKKYEQWKSNHSELFEKFLIKKIMTNFSFVSVDDYISKEMKNTSISELSNKLYHGKTFQSHYEKYINFIGDKNE